MIDNNSDNNSVSKIKEWAEKKSRFLVWIIIGIFVPLVMLHVVYRCMLPQIRKLQFHRLKWVMKACGDFLLGKNGRMQAMNRNFWR